MKKDLNSIVPSHSEEASLDMDHIGLQLQSLDKDLCDSQHKANQDLRYSNQNTPFD